jgi:predicted RNA-binding Zn-ribbon protein involved in translation (DUF1610 family)
MEKVKDIKRIKQILNEGKTTFLDPETGYKYSLCATCQNDGHDCSLNSYERKGGETSSIYKVIFMCPICGNRFDASTENMFLI